MIRLLAKLMSVVLFCGIYSQPAQPQSSTPAPQSPASAEQKKKTVYEPATVLKVTTRLVVLDVVATDRRGQAVTDLKPQDFTVLEDGKRQEVRMFNFRHPPLTNAALAAQKPIKLPPNVFANIPAYNPSNSLNVIVLDLLNTDFDDQAYGRQQILKYLASIPEGEPIAVAVYILGKKLHLVQDFTSDFAALRTAINEIKSEHSVVLDNPAAGVSPDVKELVPPPPTRLKEFSKVYEGTEQLDRRVQYTLDGLMALARHLSGYAGRKNLIWISTAFPIGVGPDESLGPNEFDNLRDYQQAIISASQALVDAQIAVYPVDPRGPLGESMYGGHGTAPDSQVMTLTAETGSGVAEQNTMKQVAQLTGGKAYYNQNDIDDAIRNSIADGSTYYTLAYNPDNKEWNGEFRKIAVKVDRRGVKLRHRPGYYALKTSTALDSRLIYAAFGRALNLDSPISTGLRFEAGLVQPSAKTQNKALLNFALDPHAVSFEKQDDGLQHAKVDCVVEAFTDKGQLVKTDASTLTVALDAPTFAKAMQSFLKAQVSIDLAPGFYLLRLGVMDERTGLIGTTTATVTIAPSTAEGKTEGIKP
ncbi:MAG TPA: VWA domain-containing protein [Candidatus Angelobacter sp.]